jgi:hypothetical protein
MNLRMQSLFRRLMDVADDNGSSGVVDRGDKFTPPDTSVEDAAAAAAAAAAALKEEEDVAAAALKLAEDAAGGAKATDKSDAARDPDTGKFIPKSRFDEQVSKERTRAEAAERRLAEIEQQQKQLTRTVDLDKAAAEVVELRKLERKALLDGDEEKATQLSAQADLLNRRIAIAEAGHLSSQDKDQALEDMRMELTIERLEEKYPVLNTASEEFDQDIVDDILDKQQGLMQRERLSPSKALAKATESVMKRYTPKTDTAGTAKPGLGAAQVGTDRKAAAVAKAVDAAARQPGSLKDAGLDSDKGGQRAATPDAGDMTVEEFAALPEATRAKMRGDYA